MFIINKVILIGRLTKDVELRQTQGQRAVGRFTLALNRPFANAQGEREADFVRIVTWGKLEENCAANIGKGRLVAVSGRIQTGSYEDSEGVTRYTTEVVADAVQFLDWPKERRGNGADIEAVDDGIDYSKPPPF